MSDATATWIQTYSGVRFDLAAPRAVDVRIVDIAHALSQTVRFGGHGLPYTVAQHCVLVARHLTVENRLAGLLHDAAEAYVGDVVTPLKHLLGPAYEDIEHRVMAAIAMHYELESSLPDAVREADRRMLATEVRDVMQTDWPDLAQPYPEPIEVWDAACAMDEYLDEFDHACGQLGCLRHLTKGACYGTDL